MATLDFADYLNVELDGVDMKTIELDGEVVFTRADLPIFTDQPDNLTVDSNKNFKAKVAVDWEGDEGTLEWFLNGAAQPNSNMLEYTFAGQASGAYQIYCNATNKRGTTKSDEATITVKSARTVTVAKWSEGSGFSKVDIVGSAPGRGNIAGGDFEGSPLEELTAFLVFGTYYVRVKAATGNKQFAGVSSLNVVIDGVTYNLVYSSSNTFGAGYYNSGGNPATLYNYLSGKVNVAVPFEINKVS